MTYVVSCHPHDLSFLTVTVKLLPRHHASVGDADNDGDDDDDDDDDDIGSGHGVGGD